MLTILFILFNCCRVSRQPLAGRWGRGSPGNSSGPRPVAAAAPRDSARSPDAERCLCGRREGGGLEGGREGRRKEGGKEAGAASGRRGRAGGAARRAGRASWQRDEARCGAAGEARQRAAALRPTALPARRPRRRLGPARPPAPREEQLLCSSQRRIEKGAGGRGRREKRGGKKAARISGLLKAVKELPGQAESSAKIALPGLGFFFFFPLSFSRVHRRSAPTPAHTQPLSLRGT